ncbi:MAG TPA: nitroreductase [Sphingomonas sp.]
MMLLDEAIHGRRATRSFTPEPVDGSMLERLVDAAIFAPSAVNEQPWHFTVVRNRPLLDRISAEAKAHMLETMGDGNLPERLHQHLDDPDFHVFYHAPALILISAGRGQWAVENAALAAENLMLAAHGLGLGSCWIGFAQRWLETGPGMTLLGIPASVLPVAPIIVGHPAGAVPPVPRNPPVLRWID